MLSAAYISGGVSSIQRDRSTHIVIKNHAMHILKEGK